MMTLGAVHEVKAHVRPQPSLPSPSPALIRPEPDWADAGHRRLKDLIFTVSSIGLVGVVLLTCIFASVSREGSPEDKTWAKAVVIGSVAGFFGFHAGRLSRPAGLADGGR